MIPVGSRQGLAIYLDGVNLPDEVYQDFDIDAFADQILAATSPIDGSINGSWMGPEETAIYVYGPDAEELLKRLEPLLRDSPICRNARIVVRHGNPNLLPRTVRMPMQ